MRVFYNHWTFRVAFLLALVCFCITPLTASAQNDGETLQDLDAKIEILLRDGSIPGASIAIIENGEIVFHKHYGVSNLKTGARVNDETIFRAGSISKSFTSIAAMMLTEQSDLNLNDPVAQYLPDLKIKNRWDETDPVRLVHLLEHTAGLNDISFRHYLLSGAHYSVEDAVDLYQPYVSRWKPGTRTSYSNSGPVIAGRIIEIISGTSFENHTQENLLKPLGMTQSRWTKTPDLAEHFSSSYFGDSDEEDVFIEIPGRPSGSLNTTALNLAQLPLLMLGRGELNGQSFFSPETANRIERPESTDAARAGLEYGYGLGNVADPNGKTVFFGHDGSIDGFASVFAYSPDLNSGYVVLVNRTSPNMTKIGKDIRKYLERELVAPSLKSVQTDDLKTERLAGQFKSSTPRRAFLKPILGMAQWDGLSFEDQTIRFKGKTYEHVGEGRLQAEGTSAPSLVILDDDYGIRVQSALATYRRVPTSELATKSIVVVWSLVILLITILHFLFWLPGHFRKALQARGGVAARALPASAFLMSIVAFIAPLTVTGFSSLGTPNLSTWSVFAISVIAPFLTGLAFFKLFSFKTPKAITLLAILQIAIAAIICIYLFKNGWFALKLWNA